MARIIPPPPPEPPIHQRLSELLTTASDWINGHTTQIAVSILLGAAIVGLLYGAKLLGGWLLDRKPDGAHWLRIAGRTLVKTRLWFMVAVAAQVIAWIGRAPAELAWAVKAVFIVATGWQVALWARALILGLVERRASETDPHGSLQSAVGLIRVLVTVALFFLAAILVLANLGFDVTGLLAGLGIGGIAIGLAAQGIFTDLFAALSILFDKPFRKGDVIRWDTTTGTVEAIGLKSSRVRALTGEEVVISNANLLNKELHNFARIEHRRINQPLSLVSHLPVETCKAIPGLLEGAINAQAGCAFVRCGLENFAPSSLDFMLVYDIDAEEQGDVLARKNAANLAILQSFNDQGIAFAYPTQTTYTAAPNGTMVMPYAQPVDPAKPSRRKG